jgi:uncharacterized protein (DUF169 family)
LRRGKPSYKVAAIVGSVIKRMEGRKMISNAKLAEDLTASLKLVRAPIALSFPAVAPANIPPYDGTAPAGCVFWQEAATRTFVTSSKDHALCSIGVHTHHLTQPARTYLTELSDALKAMGDLDYVRPEEVAAIPIIKQEIKHVVYGPLAQFPLFAEVVILFAHARQGLILSEAVTRVDKGIPPAMGRPACAMVPQVLNRGSAAMSLGCCGARAYLDALTDDVAMWALPGGKLEQYTAEIAALARANETLTKFHLRRREDVEAGKHPTVKQSLERLSS